MKTSFRLNESTMERYLERLQDMQRGPTGEAAPASEDGHLGFLVFALDGQEFALELGRVRSVLALPKVTRVPFAPSYYRGVINFHGQIVSVMDLRARLGLETAEPGPEAAVVVVDRGTYATGLVVDSINRVLYVKEEEDVRPVQKLDLGQVLAGGKL